MVRHLDEMKWDWEWPTLLGVLDLGFQKGSTLLGFDALCFPKGPTLMVLPPSLSAFGVGVCSFICPGHGFIILIVSTVVW
jgi:hypothetical protein